MEDFPGKIYRGEFFAGEFPVERGGFFQRTIFEDEFSRGEFSAERTFHGLVLHRGEFSIGGGIFWRDPLPRGEFTTRIFLIHLS